MSNVTQADRVRSGPLRDVTVVDLTQHLAGPFASQILGDLGARIIKVEPPAGDSTRHIGPYFVAGQSAYFLSVNRNKESVCLDLKSRAGRDALLGLVAKADIVLENFRPGTLQRLGIDYPVLKGVNKKIILCSISGFGQDGPYRDRPAFDMIVQALSGGMSLTGEADGQPVRSGLPIGDLCAGMYAVIGSLAAFAHVAARGTGTCIDVAMLDSQISMLSYVATYYLTSAALPGRQGREHMSIPTYRAFTCGDDQDIVVTANTERMWAGLCVALDVPELTTDERFLTNDDRRQHRSQLDPLLSAAALRWPASDLLERLRREGVPCAPLNGVDDALDNPQVRHRGMVLELPLGREFVQAVGDPIKMPDGRRTHLSPPRLGEHTEEVLRSVAGLDDAAIQRLNNAGAIRPERNNPASPQVPPGSPDARPPAAAQQTAADRQIADDGQTTDDGQRDETEVGAEPEQLPRTAALPAD